MSDLLNRLGQQSKLAAQQLCLLETAKKMTVCCKWP